MSARHSRSIRVDRVNKAEIGDHSLLVEIVAELWLRTVSRKDTGRDTSMRIRFALKSLVSDERGFVVSSELIMIATIAVLGLLVGLSAARDAVVSELSDVVGSLQDINQSYSIDGVVYHNSNTAGFDYLDDLDECDSADQSDNDVVGMGMADNCITFESGQDIEEGAAFTADNFPRNGEPIP